ncbi:MAG: DUF2993 domain-containing protein [Cyanobacteria bacterium J06559_3]
MDSQKEGGSRIIGRILPAAVRLWLRSQVENVEALSLTLEGRDRQILSGYLPGVLVSAEQAIYQGIYINRLKLSAKDIRINIGQVIRGKPLRLLQVFPVFGEVALTGDDLNASLASPLLRSGLKDFWRLLVQDSAFSQSVEERYGMMALHPEMVMREAQIRLGDRTLALSFYPQVEGQMADVPIVLATGLSVISGNVLQLESPRWLETLDALIERAQNDPIELLQGFQWDLGKDTQLTQLALTPENLLCDGQIMVNP